MNFHFPPSVKIEVESSFSLICTFLNNFENKLFLIKKKLKLKETKNVSVVIAVYYRATWRTFEVQARKIKKKPLKKVIYSGNRTFQL